MSNAAYPLQWPVGQKRWPGQRVNSQFKMTPSAMVDHLHLELERLGAHNVVISTNRAGYSRSNALLEDPGAAVYFTRKGRDLVIACDKYRRVEDNIHAIGIAVEGFRAMERHGTGDMVDAAFTGFTALPEAIVTPQRKTWWQILGVKEDASVQEINNAYRNKARTAHPDTPGGSQEAFIELKKALEEGLNR